MWQPEVALVQDAVHQPLGWSWALCAGPCSCATAAWGAFSARLVMGEVRELCFAFLAFHTEITIKAVISRKVKDQLESKYEFDKEKVFAFLTSW